MDRFMDFAVSGKFGKPWECGQKICGKGYCGEEEIQWDKNELGFAICGMTICGSDDKRWGIYHRRKENGKIFYVRENFYQGWGTGTEAQEATRNKFKTGMEAWKNLTENEKKAYHIRATKRQMMAQNLFMKEYLNSN